MNANPCPEPYQPDELRQEDERTWRDGNIYRLDDWEAPVRPPRPDDDPRDVAVCIERIVSAGVECLTYIRRGGA